MKTFIVKSWDKYQKWPEYQKIFSKASGLIKFGPAAIAIVKPENVSGIKTQLQKLKIPFVGSAA